jgi:magnesium transporter
MAAALTEANLNDPVTNHMRREVARLQLGQTVSQALEEVRARPPEGRIIYFYVVDGENRLQGVVPTRRLLLSPLTDRIDQIMVPQVIALPAGATVLDACEFFTLHRFLAFPVVDDERRLLGIVDVELYTEELSDLSRGEPVDDLFQLIGVHVAQARQTAPVRAFRARFPWLLFNVTGGMLAALLCWLYQEVLDWHHAVLALFVPLVLALAESVSIQSVSLTLELLHGKAPTWSAMWKKLRAEMITGAMLGVVNGLVIGLVVLAWLRMPWLAVCLLGGIAGGVTAAAVVGLALPNVLRLLRLQPQVAAGPIALAAADMLTLLLYFNLARWLLITR